MSCGTNFFAFGAEGGLAWPRDEECVRFLFEGNIVDTGGALFFTGTSWPGRFNLTGGLYLGLRQPGAGVPYREDLRSAAAG